MAARQLARLRAKQEAALQDASPEADASEEEITPVASRSSAPFNPFDLLDDNERPAAGPSDASEDEVSSSAPKAEAAPAGGRSKSKKKQKKKSKGKGKTPTDVSPVRGNKPVEDLDQLLQELNISVPEPSAAQEQEASPQRQGGRAQVHASILAVNPRRLRPDDEMRRIFGSRIVDTDDNNGAADGVAGAPRRVRRLAARGWLRRQGPPLKKGLLIAPRDTWPRLDGGLSMETVGCNEEGNQVFRYTHSAGYQAVQADFMDAQATYDPNQVAAILHNHPYHIDTLLSMFELHRVTGQHDFAEELLHRCLYALEQAWHPSFNPTTANCRLPYEDESNRSLFYALNRYIQSLSRRGLHATALEVCKLTLALDHYDPIGLVLSMDYYAIRAQQYNFLIRLIESQNFGSYPNMAFSHALAMYHYSQTDECDDEEMSKDALSRLTDAVVQYPMVITTLMDKLKEGGVTLDGDWQSLLNKELFRNADFNNNGSLEFLVRNYVERSHGFWKGQEMLGWLKSACHQASEEYERDSISREDEMALREELYPAGAPNEYAYLRSFMDTSDGVPMEEAQAMLRGPPAPPPVVPEDLVGEQDIVNALEHLVRARGPGNEIPEEELRQMGPVGAFLRTLLPWVDVNRLPALARDHEANQDVLDDLVQVFEDAAEARQLAEQQALEADAPGEGGGRADPGHAETEEEALIPPPAPEID